MAKTNRKIENTKYEDEKKQGNSLQDKHLKGLDTGWSWVVLFASFGVLFILGGNLHGVGIIHAVLLDQYKESVTLTSWTGALLSAMFSLSGPLGSVVIDRFSCRTALVLSGIFLMIGYIGTAFAKSIEVTIFTCGILAGLGGGFGCTSSFVVIGYNFKRRRHIAFGLGLSGVGLGLFSLAPIMQLARDYYGPIGFFLILAAISANIITFGVMCFPSSLEKATHLQRASETKNKAEDPKFCYARFNIYKEALCNKAVICLCICNLCYGFGTYLIYLHLPTFIVSKGFTAIEASFLVSISGIVTIIGRILAGILAQTNCINVTFIYSCSMGVVSIASFLYPFTSEYFIGHVVFVIFLGLFLGCCNVTLTAVTIPFVGIDFIAAALGIQFFFCGIGSFAGPVIAGSLVDGGGTYEQSIYLAASCILLAAIFSAITVFFKRKDDDVNNDEKDEIQESQATKF